MSSLPLVLLILSFVAATQAICLGNLLIDDYSNYINHKNSLGLYTSDDGTARNLTVNVIDKKLLFNALSSSYFYTNFGCLAANSQHYTAITFPIKGPVGGSFVLELQTMKGCSATDYTSTYYPVPTKTTGTTITVTVPLNAFLGAGLDAVHAVVFETFTPAVWEIGSTELVCASNQSISINGSTTALSQPSSVATFSTLAPITASTSSARVSSSNSTVAPSTGASLTGPSTAPTRSLSTSTSSTSLSTALSVPSTSISSNSTLPIPPSTIPSSSSSSSVSMTTTRSIAAASCSTLIVDEFSSSSRLLSRHINALSQPSSDDATMKSLTVANDHLTLTPQDTKSYFYTNFSCLNATKVYAGILIMMSAAKHTVITFELRTNKTGPAGNTMIIDVTSKALALCFDGTEKVYAIPFAGFPGLDNDSLVSFRLFGTRNTVTLGTISLYCEVAGVYERN